MTNRSSVWLIALFGMATAVSECRSDIITYTFSGSGSGLLNGVSFTDADFVIELVADSTTLHSFSGIPAINLSTQTLNIAGFSPTMFTNPNNHLFINAGSTAVGFGYPVTDYLDVQGAAFGAWDLLSPVGPVFDATPLYVGFFGAPTAAGPLYMNGGTGGASDITFTATVSAVPEPVSSLLVGLIGSLTCAFRVSRRRAAK